VNRKEFLELLGITVPAITAPKFIRKGSTMSFTELLEKMAGGNQLTSWEIEQLKTEGRAMERAKKLVEDWTVLGSDQFKLIPPMSTIYSEVFAVDTASIDVPIPTDFKHIVIMGQGRMGGSGGLAPYILLELTFNGDTGTNYSRGYNIVQAGTHFVNQTLNGTRIHIADVTADQVSAGRSSGFTVFIPHVQSSYYKHVDTIQSVHWETDLSFGQRSGIWKDTSGIDKITLFADTSTYANAVIEAGSLISVYGIR